MPAVFCWEKHLQKRKLQNEQFTNTYTHTYIRLYISILYLTFPIKKIFFVKKIKLLVNKVMNFNNYL